MKLDLVFTGVGGQGIVVLSDIFCEAALSDGFDVAKAEIHGMAQRGGSISAHVRIGDRVLSPLIEHGQADIIIGFEVLETARSLFMLKKTGCVVVNTKYIPPSNMSQTPKESLELNDLLSIIRSKAARVHEIDGAVLASEIGNPLVVNTILLGAVSALPEIPIRQESFKNALTSRFKEKYIKINLQAFQLGRKNVLIS